ncbi:hypothetical protein [Microbacterium terricola]|uniref:DUF916 domain-containing protein n=1 Tax=Microbacterium terricola TaxID=344163 RepID=A0ABM8E2N0_9MICO|nr:hypothetical protein [Microbacterium terricola]UYK40079.1 hypothetical protein OAU46_00045 [Microbacterium terricola]BDV32224.1 hypothetical protein Microterr_28840 [Microbacterium terricola]
MPPINARRPGVRTRRVLGGASMLLVALGVTLLGGTAAWASAPLPAQGAVVRQAAACTEPDVDADGGVLLSAEVLGPAPDCDAEQGGSDDDPVPGGLGAAPPSDASGPSDVAPDPEPTPIADDETDLGGILTVSGLEHRYTPSLNPAAGDIQVSVTLRNVSESTIDADTVFWVQTPFGNGVGQNVTVTVDNLKPGETRVMTASIEDVGQWGMYFAHATILPPDEVDGVELSPLVRDATVFAFPWFVAIVLIVVATAWWGVRAARGSWPARTAEVTA